MRNYAMFKMLKFDFDRMDVMSMCFGITFVVWTKFEDWKSSILSHPTSKEPFQGWQSPMPVASYHLWWVLDYGNCMWNNLKLEKCGHKCHKSFWILRDFYYVIPSPWAFYNKVLYELISPTHSLLYGMGTRSILLARKMTSLDSCHSNMLSPCILMMNKLTLSLMVQAYHITIFVHHSWDGW